MSPNPKPIWVYGLGKTLNPINPLSPKKSYNPPRPDLRGGTKGAFCHAEGWLLKICVLSQKKKKEDPGTWHPSEGTRILRKIHIADAIVSQNRGSQYRPHNALILLLGTSIMVPLILGNPYTCSAVSELESVEQKSVDVCDQLADSHHFWEACWGAPSSSKRFGI